MKLKVIKPHYYNGSYQNIGVVYMADVNYGQSAIKRGNCVEIKMPTRADRIKEVANKKHPKTRKKAIKIK